MKLDRIKWRVKGFQELRRSPEVKADLARRAEAIAAASGEGFEARHTEGKTRARSAVVTVHPRAMRKPNKMLENMDRGR